MGDRYLKKCAVSLATTEMPIKTIPVFHLILEWRANFKVTNNNACWKAVGDKESFHILVGLETGAFTMVISMEISQKNRTRN